MTDLARSPALACGVQPELLLASVADGDETVASAHVAACQHCRAVLDRLTPGLEQLHVVAAIPLGVPGQVQRRVLAQVRRLRQGTVVDLAPPSALGAPGRTTVATDVVALLAAAGAEQVEGVGKVQVTVRVAPLIIEVSLAVGGQRPIPEVAGAVRSAVARVVANQLALPVIRTDIDVTGIDLLPGVWRTGPGR